MFCCALTHMSLGMTMICVPSEDSSAWASTQSDQSSLCTQWVAQHPKFHHADTKLWSGRCPGCSVFAGCMGHFVGFVMLWLIMVCKRWQTLLVWILHHFRSSGLLSYILGHISAIGWSVFSSGLSIFALSPIFGIGEIILKGNKPFPNIPCISQMFHFNVFQQCVHGLNYMQNVFHNIFYKAD